MLLEPKSVRSAPGDLVKKKKIGLSRFSMGPKILNFKKCLVAIGSFTTL